MAQSGLSQKLPKVHQIDSERQIKRYIRLINLIPDILKLVDEGKIALTPAVELSYLQPSEQEMLFSVMDSDEVTPSLS